MLRMHHQGARGQAFRKCVSLWRFVIHSEWLNYAPSAMRNCDSVCAFQKYLIITIAHNWGKNSRDWLCSCETVLNDGLIDKAPVQSKLPWRQALFHSDNRKGHLWMVLKANLADQSSSNSLKEDHIVIDKLELRISAKTHQSMSIWKQWYMWSCRAGVADVWLSYSTVGCKMFVSHCTCVAILMSLLWCKPLVGWEGDSWRTCSTITIRL